MKLKAKLKIQLTWLILGIIFLAPLTLASWFYAHPAQVLSMTSVNHGYLFQPPLNINDLQIKRVDNQKAWDETQLQRHWWILFYAPKVNNEQWQHGLYQMRQVRIALGKDQDRVERVIVVPNNLPRSKLHSMVQANYQGTVEAMIAPGLWDQQVIAKIKKPLDLSHGSFYIIDPHGNLILAYPANVSPRHLYQDITRLLRASSIG